VAGVSEKTSSRQLVNKVTRLSVLLLKGNNREGLKSGRRYTIMAQEDQYFLGYSPSEQERLRWQAQQLAHEARWLLDRIGLASGARVIEIGCGPQGCLDLLAERVGPEGSVVGVERGEDAVSLARTFAQERGLMNVEVLQGDARDRPT